MDGIIIVNKDKDYTSRDVVNVISKVLKTKKVGHTGTLDPLATGVLVVCVGNATKLVDMITDLDKEYIAEAVLGMKTDTMDVTGNVLERQDVTLLKDDIEPVLKSMIGKYEQEVPSYSAVKINGKKLYEYAREGKEVLLPKRQVEVKELKLINEVKYCSNKTIFEFVTTVSKGTYIRSLIMDIARKLNTVGSMVNLQRTRQGRFKIEDACTLEDIKNGNYKLLSIEEVLDIEKVLISEEIKKQVYNGAVVPNIYNKKEILFVDNKGAVAIYKEIDGKLKAHKMFRVEG